LASISTPNTFNRNIVDKLSVRDSGVFQRQTTEVSQSQRTNAIFVKDSNTFRDSVIADLKSGEGEDPEGA
jgi:hypothetical protein